jgi:hypothetical protein
MLNVLTYKHPEIFFKKFQTMKDHLYLYISTSNNYQWPNLQYEFFFLNVWMIMTFWAAFMGEH